MATLPIVDDGQPDLHVTATNTGIVVTATVNGHKPPPTRYALALRRQAANRIRLRRAGRDAVLPDIRPGGCVNCEGWGVVGSDRHRCPNCNGTGGPDV